MDPAVAAILTMLATAVVTAILRFSAYRWPPGHHREGAVKDDDVERD